MNLEKVFNNYKLNKSITYSTPVGFTMIKSNKILYYVTDYNLDKIFAFDDDWNILFSKSFPKACYPISTGNYLYITGDNKIWKTDSQLNILVQFNKSFSYRGLYHNSTSDLLYVATHTISIEIFDLNLNLIESIPTSPYHTRSITAQNSKMFVGTIVGVILQIINNEIIHKFNACNGNSIALVSILIDEFSNMATLCNNRQLHLYSTSGTYNRTIETLEHARFIGFDSKSRFVLLNSQISIFNTL